MRADAIGCNATQFVCNFDVALCCRGIAVAAGYASEFTAEQKTRILKGLHERERWFELVDLYKTHVSAIRP